MKKTLLVVLLVCLVVFTIGCKSKNADSLNEVDDLLNQIEIGEHYEKTQEKLGEPDSYFAFGGGEISGDFPMSFFMDYGGFHIVIVDYSVHEIRILSDKYSYDSQIYVGQNKLEALRLLSPPLEVLEGENRFSAKFILLNNMPALPNDKTNQTDDEVSYYDDPLSDTRVFFLNNEVSAVYFYKYDMRHEDGEGFDLKYGLAERQSNSGEFKPQVRDEVKYEFIDDENIIGTWKYVNILIRKDDFPTRGNANKVNFSEVSFLENGEIEKSIYTWSKGHLFNTYYNTIFKYEIKEVDDKEYLMVMPIDDDETYLYVLEKLN